MRTLLVSLLLLIVVIAIYTKLAEGEEGTKAQIKQYGSRMGDAIRRTSP